MIKRFLSILSILCVLSTFAKAQSSTTETEQVDINLVNVITLKFVATGTSTGSTVNIPIGTLAEYTSGVTSAAQQLTISSTKAFSITAKANAANFTYTGTYTTGTTMPVSGKLLLMVPTQATGGTIASPFSAYSTLTSSNQNIIINGTPGSNKTFSVQYKATPGFGYPAGTYTTQVIYTATQL